MRKIGLFLLALVIFCLGVSKLVGLVIVIARTRLDVDTFWIMKQIVYGIVMIFVGLAIFRKR